MKADGRFLGRGFVTDPEADHGDHLQQQGGLVGGAEGRAVQDRPVRVEVSEVEVDVGGEPCDQAWFDGGKWGGSGGREALILLPRLLRLQLSLLLTMLLLLLLLLLFLGSFVDTTVWLVATSIARGAGLAAGFGQATVTAGLRDLGRTRRPSRR